MTEDVLKDMANGKKFFTALDADEIVDIEIDKGFERSLLEETITLEEIKRHAPWNQRDNEGNEPYAAFKAYINLDITDWNPSSICEFESLGVEEGDVAWWVKEFEWKPRRMAHLKYDEWLRRRREELRQIENIESFRDNQADLLKSSSRSAVSLMAKLNQRIEELEPEDIKAADIPKFVSTLATFLDMASDAEARYTTINELLALYESDIDTKAIQDHMNHAEDLRKKAKRGNSGK